MNKDSVLKNLFNGQSMDVVIPLFIWGLIGLLFSAIVDLLRNHTKIERTGGFSWAFWLGDNSLRFILSLLAVFIGSVFNDKLLGISGNIGALLVGFCTDKLIEALVKFKDKINFDNILGNFIKK